jgi:hypothetical protein
MSKQDAITKATTGQGVRNMACFLAKLSHIAALASNHVNNNRDPQPTSLKFLLQTLEEVEKILGDDDFGNCAIGEGLWFPTSTSTNSNNQWTREQQDHYPSKQ